MFFWKEWKSAQELLWSFTLRMKALCATQHSACFHPLTTGVTSLNKNDEDCETFNISEWLLPFFYFLKYLIQFWCASKLVKSSSLRWLTVNFFRWLSWSKHFVINWHYIIYQEVGRMFYFIPFWCFTTCHPCETRYRLWVFSTCSTILHTCCMYSLFQYRICHTHHQVPLFVSVLVVL